ncbi:MAG: Nuclease (SNase domain protein) [Candidatus Roizmanbacteria bacterium GW2011_GWA2_35_19]|uniref:Nuclease (SNase domain protein) n=1 Tax=Candidatus Roizmanbacteria bacterium GW2011_GWA2_35_19 TaxID=1618478 RepID=A0A0G0BR47_9BACT|nr:MAG: Nuclease (SNase domain protein) [Candidatus Roizmanbacteria bacterium GW2011_GWA2_35_19]
MKNKALSYIVVFVLVLISFFGGSYFEKQKIKTQSSVSSDALVNAIPITVIEVSDGDTFKLSSGQTFRLYGVNAPEVKELFFEEAKAFTQNLVLNKEISFEQEENYKIDKFSRTLGYVFIDGVNLNIELVKNGLARVVLYEKRAKIKYQDELLSAEKTAKELRLGIWKK